jgi:hypothetical protein
MKNRLIHYAETFETVTPESAENGEAADSGFISEETTDDFRAMASLLACTEPSDYPLPADGSRVWYTQLDSDIDYRTGAEERRSYHPKTHKDGRFMRLAYLATHKPRQRWAGIERNG